MIFLCCLYLHKRSKILQFNCHKRSQIALITGNKAEFSNSIFLSFDYILIKTVGNLIVTIKCPPIKFDLPKFWHPKSQEGKTAMPKIDKSEFVFVKVAPHVKPTGSRLKNFQKSNKCLPYNIFKIQIFSFFKKVIIKFIF